MFHDAYESPPINESAQTIPASPSTPAILMGFADDRAMLLMSLHLLRFVRTSRRLCVPAAGFCELLHKED